MPTPEFARELVLEAESWVAEGVVTRDQADRLRARYAPLLSQPGRYRAADPARGRASRGLLAEFLYALAGLLVGAAAVAVLVAGLGLENDPAAFLVAGLLLAAGGAALRFAPLDRPHLPDALMAAGLVPLTLAVFPEDGPAYAPFAVGVPLVLLFWRREATFLPGLAALAFSVAAAGTFFRIFDDVAAVPWLLAQLALLVGILVSDRLLRGADSPFAAGVATAALAVAAVVYAGETLELADETLELAVGAFYLGLLGLGVVLRHRGVVVAAAGAVALDAIVFAFDVGGVLLGAGILVGLAALLVWQAETLKRFLAS